ncbi:hypothetical protein BRD17_00300 [Halobacteriales archaeon SW_7_68_16]|nr:MAG: hypothetical protein BRD17_00300 [Halobacteriales archaeon SW_7_68_16]
MGNRFATGGSDEDGDAYTDYGDESGGEAARQAVLATTEGIDRGRGIVTDGQGVGGRRTVPIEAAAERVADDVGVETDAVVEQLREAVRRGLPMEEAIRTEYQVNDTGGEPVAKLTERAVREAEKYESEPRGVHPDAIVDEPAPWSPSTADAGIPEPGDRLRTDDAERTIDLERADTTVSGNQNMGLYRHVRSDGPDVFGKRCSPKDGTRSMAAETVLDRLDVGVPEHHYDLTEGYLRTEYVEGERLFDVYAARTDSATVSDPSLREQIDSSEVDDIAVDPDDIDPDSYCGAVSGMILSGNFDFNGGNVMITPEGESVVIDNGDAGSSRVSAHGPDRDLDIRSIVGDAVRWADRMGLDVEASDVRNRLERDAREVDLDDLTDEVRTVGDRVASDPETLRGRESAGLLGTDLADEAAEQHAVANGAAENVADIVRAVREGRVRGRTDVAAHQRRVDEAVAGVADDDGDYLVSLGSDEDDEPGTAGGTDDGTIDLATPDAATGGSDDGGDAVASAGADLSGDEQRQISRHLGIDEGTVREAYVEYVGEGMDDWDAIEAIYDEYA